MHQPTKYHLFDLGGTLIDSVATKREACKLFIAERGRNINHDEVDHQIDEISISSVRTRTLIKKVCMPLMDGYEAQDDDENLFKDIENSLPRKLIKGVTEYLKRLQKTGASIAIVTNSGKKRIPNGVWNTDLGHFFDSDRIIHRESEDEPKKPNPHLYKKALKQLGANGANSIAYEDTPCGIQSVLTAGICRCIGMATTDQHDKTVLSNAGAHKIHTDFTEILQMAGEAA